MDSEDESPDGYDFPNAWAESSSEEEDYGDLKDVGTWQEVDDIEVTSDCSRGWRPPVSKQPDKPGPRGFAVDATLLTIFLALLGPLVQLGVQYTNLYARQTFRRGFTDLSSIEFLAFFGLILYFGRKNLSRVDAWRDYPWGDPFCKGCHEPDSIQ